jgi:hypothetical protein
VVFLFAFQPFFLSFIHSSNLGWDGELFFTFFVRGDTGVEKIVHKGGVSIENLSNPRDTPTFFIPGYENLAREVV